MPVLRLAIPSPLRQAFDYLPPEELGAQDVANLRAGSRLLVPFGSRTVVATLLEVVDNSDYPLEKMRRVLRCLDLKPLLSPGVVQLCHWASQYYKHSPGDVFSAAFPTALRKDRDHETASSRHWQLTVAGQGLPVGALARAKRQAQALAILQRGAIAEETVTELALSKTALKELQKKGLAEMVRHDLEIAATSVNPGPTLNPEQEAALAAIREYDGTFHCHLLEGVTGSGKTEVYLALIADCLARGRQALVLVPEIGLTPQTLSRFEQRFDACITVMHSGLAEGERLRAWEAARSGRAHIVLGTRSAIFCSLHKPGLIIVDEEHDGSYKQQDGLRYSARDLAVKRGQLENLPVILGSATPSLETLHNALAGRYQHLQLSQRAGRARLPELQVLDIRRSALQGGMAAPLLAEVESQLQRGKQVLLFLNRRGFAPTLQCHDCGWVAECQHCDARMTLHRAARQLRCHHCDWVQAVPGQCPGCRSSVLTTSGLGTEQTALFLNSRFPEVELHRVDSDTMARKGAMQTLLANINRGEPCIILGTQMLAKGHHFPAVTLAAIIDADSSLFSGDFRGPERMGQLLTQVAGRSGRDSEAGIVIIQTHHPDHPLLTSLLHDGYHRYARNLLTNRRAANMPPYSYLVLMRAEAKTMEQAESYLGQLRQRIGGAVTATLIGPLPAPMPRKSGRYRCHLLLNAPSRHDAQQAAELLHAAAAELPEGKRLRWAIDVDPQDIF